MTKTEKMMENPLVSLGLIKEAVGNILMTNDDVNTLAMPYLSRIIGLDAKLAKIYMGK